MDEMPTFYGLLKHCFADLLLIFTYHVVMELLTTDEKSNHIPNGIYKFQDLCLSIYLLLSSLRQI